MRTSTFVGLTTIAVVGVGLHFLDKYSSEVLEHFRGQSRTSTSQQSAAPGAAEVSAIAAETPPQAAPVVPSAEVATRTAPPAAPEVEALWPGSKVERLAVGMRRYSDLTVVTVTSETVTFRGGREIVSVPTLSLPAELKDRALVYLSDSGRSIPTRTGSPAFPAHSQSIAEKPAPREAVVVPKETVYLPEYAPMIAKLAAFERADKWFRFERQKDPADILPLSVEIKLEDPILVSESAGYWRVRGQGHVDARRDSGDGSVKRSQNFEVTVVIDAQGNVSRPEITLL